MAAPIFILSSGRSGSTLLQRMLNCCPGVTIWGEHSGLLAPLAAAYFHAVEHPLMLRNIYSQNRSVDVSELLSERRQPDQWQAWMNWWRPEDMDEAFRAMVASMFQPPALGARCTWGFKEIRYGVGDRTIEMLARLFPTARFVFLSRNGLNTIASQVRTFHPPTHIPGYAAVRNSLIVIQRARRWRLQNASFLEWHRSKLIRSSWVVLEQFVSDRALRESLFAGLDLPYGAAQEAVLERREGRGSAYTSGDLDDRWRAMGLLPRLCAEVVLAPVNSQLGYRMPFPLSLFQRWRAHS